MKSLVKARPVHVLLDEDDVKDLDRLVGREVKRRRDATIGRATLLRELAMPRVRELLAEAQEAVA